MKSDVSAKSPSHARHRDSARPRPVHFEYTDARAHRVSLVGSFNDWQPESDPMTATGNGRWMKDVSLRPGTYEYRYVVDGNWIQDPNAEHSVTNPFGERNSLVSVTNRNGNGK